MATSCVRLEWQATGVMHTDGRRRIKRSISLQATVRHVRTKYVVAATLQRRNLLRTRTISGDASPPPPPFAFPLYTQHRKP